MAPQVPVKGGPADPQEHELLLALASAGDSPATDGGPSPAIDSDPAALSLAKAAADPSPATDSGLAAERDPTPATDGGPAPAIDSDPAALSALPLGDLHVPSRAGVNSVPVDARTLVALARKPPVVVFPAPSLAPAEVHLLQQTARGDLGPYIAHLSQSGMLRSWLIIAARDAAGDFHGNPGMPSPVLVGSAGTGPSDPRSDGLLAIFRAGWDPSLLWQPPGPVLQRSVRDEVEVNPSPGSHETPLGLFPRGHGARLSRDLPVRWETWPGS
jgi:hypothetical protein